MMTQETMILRLSIATMTKAKGMRAEVVLQEVAAVTGTIKYK
jgi:hypothetical protein